MVLHDVPLFPLNVVLFPQMTLPLYIFEPRYRQMISECIANNSPFGVVLISEGQEVGSGGASKLHAVGTLAKITEHARNSDGTMTIMTIGTERFHLRAHREEKPYMTGDIEIWPDNPVEEDGGELARLVSNIKQTFESYLRILMELAGKRIEGLDIPDDATFLSYYIPHWLQITLEDKQRLLEIPAPRERLLEEHVLLSSEISFLQKIKERAEQESKESTDDKPAKDNKNSIASRFSLN